jgi:hypothetical protein
MSMSSKHTKNWLESLHPNITCLRHPDHIGAKGAFLVFLKLYFGRRCVFLWVDKNVFALLRGRSVYLRSWSGVELVVEPLPLPLEVEEE